MSSAEKQEIILSREPHMSNFLFFFITGSPTLLSSLCVRTPDPISESFRPMVVHGSLLFVGSVSLQCDVFRIAWGPDVNDRGTLGLIPLC